MRALTMVFFCALPIFALGSGSSPASDHAPAPAALAGTLRPGDTDSPRAPLPLWDWVRSEMGLDRPSPPPVIEVVAPERLFRLRNGRDPRAAGDLDVLAIYDRDRARILLNAEPDPADPVSQSILVHELVHHAQALQATAFACPAEAEEEAYRLQEAWLRLSDLDLRTSFGIEGLTLLLLTRCGL